MISIKRSNSLKDIIDIAIRINNRQYKRYVDKKVKTKTYLIRRFFKGDLIKLNIIKIKELKIKTYYICEKKNYLKRHYS